MLISASVRRSPISYMWLALSARNCGCWCLRPAWIPESAAWAGGVRRLLVSQCSPNFSATQYALLSALSALPRVSMGAIAGQVVAVVGWANFFVVTFLSAIPGLIVLTLFRGRINELAAREAAKR